MAHPRYPRLSHRHWKVGMDVVLMYADRLRRWPNIKTTVAQRFVVLPDTFLI